MRSDTMEGRGCGVRGGALDLVRLFWCGALHVCFIGV